MVIDKLPESVTAVFSNTGKSQVRIAWRIISTGYEGHGDWHDLCSEGFLKREMNDAQAGIPDIEH